MSGFQCQVSSSTDMASTDMARFELAYSHLVTSRVQNLFERQITLERQMASNMVELQNALATQTEADCNRRSSYLPFFPVLSDADITSVLGLDFSTLGDLALKVLQPPATTHTTAVSAAAAAAAAAVTAAAATAVILPLRSTTATKNRPTKPVKRLSARPVCRKPSKRAAPSSTTEDDLPTPTSI